MKAVRIVRVIALSSLVGIVAGTVASSIRAQRLEEQRLRDENRQARAERREQARPKVYALAGKETYVDPEAVKYLPEYPKAVVTDLAETSLAQGVPMKAGMFMTKDKLEDVLEWYRVELDKAGRTTVSQRWGDGAAYIGFYGPDQRMHTVAAMRSGSQTFVFLSNSDPEAFLRAAKDAQRPEGLPLLPSATGEMSFSFGDPGMSRQTYFASSGELSLAQARDFYRAELEKLGWRIEEVLENRPGQVHIAAKRAGNDLSLTLRRDDKENHVAVYAHVLARR